MHKIVLVRHGEAAKSATDADPGLTERGQLQAQQLAADLDKHFPEGQGVRLVSSPKTRAIQTALPIAARWEQEIEEEPRVIEIPSPQGMPLAQRGHWIKTLLNDGWNSLTPAQVQWRNTVKDYLLGLGEQRENTGNAHTTLVFCHFMVINSVIADIRNDLKVAQFHPDYTSRTELSLAGGTLKIIELGDERDIDNLIQ
ncbi:histidine phosphatase family protein [Microbulbifer sp. YPW1]|uniref:histidine phosphatase family protein n=1 Tax=Microbulbifer sp. YPW1 TaxID=2745199 RepID=UPI00159A637B|nr:histidine phosphatase family protein [Microbulbifer sp. YPW1]QKX17879.1 histidine phosphatase family protein [Microbulbifer sp. YPW1]